MKRTIFLACGIILAISVGQSGAQPPAVKPPAKKAVVAKPAATEPAVKVPAVTTPEVAANGEENEDLAAIRQAAGEFAAAFNKGDAAAVAAHWTADGEYISETGSVFSGRTAIENEYTTFFAANPGHQIGIVIDSLRLLSDSAAIEDGHFTLDQGNTSTPLSTRYTAVHVKIDGKWLMSSVRDTRIEVSSSYRNMADLEWLIGTWVAEEEGSSTESVCSWLANKRFVQRTYTVTHHDQSVTSGIQLIGFNPQLGQIQSWNFSSDGGYAIGIWSPIENGWATEIQGTRADGHNTTAVNLIKRLDNHGYSWKSIQRTVRGESLPDTNEVIYKSHAK
ncbi:MAG: SgcJ/EcaC family oxidoreductase [Planctomycetota bacterium]|nr:MAG: SgcJ/EcaC family oxidoreductase [Planctomycetota bacterium]